MITDIDRGLKRILEGDAALDRRGVKVGIQSNAGRYQDGTTILDIAIFNEFGTERIPARPFIRGAHDKFRKEAETTMAHLLTKSTEGASVHEVLHTLGQWYEGKVKGHATSGQFAPNAPSTIARKGSSKPLVDEGIMTGAIRYEVI